MQDCLVDNCHLSLLPLQSVHCWVSAKDLHCLSHFLNQMLCWLCLLHWAFKENESWRLELFLGVYPIIIAVMLPCWGKIHSLFHYLTPTNWTVLLAFHSDFRLSSSSIAQPPLFPSFYSFFLNDVTSYYVYFLISQLNGFNSHPLHLIQSSTINPP
jgi:hypothetical protein